MTDLLKTLSSSSETVKGGWLNIYSFKFYASLLSRIEYCFDL